MKILVVDDERPLVKGIKFNLENEGYEVDCCYDGKTAVEMAHTQQNFIIATCKQLGIDNLRVIRGDVFKFLSACKINYDFIYADPPYMLETIDQLPDLVLPFLRPDGWFVLEHGKTTDLTWHTRHKETREYGSVFFSFFQ